MKSFSEIRKAQGLPLNTIVIAILVIIVLLVIIVFFTTRVGETGEQLDQNSASKCDESNPAISTVYSNIDTAEEMSRESCGGNNQRIVPGISVDGENMVCCVTLESTSS